jgi:UDP-N-acetylmuramyl tripeptide synthase
MKLGELVAPGEHVGADLLAQEITSLAYDSRRVKPGDLFFAIRGEKSDGYNFVRDALERGAVAVASERPAPPDLAGRWVRVSHARRALAEAARAFYGDPASRLQLVGITGTNGKTTTAFLLHDPIAVAEIQQHISNLKRSGLAILITDHNVRETLEIVDRAYLIYDGRVESHGTREFLINDPVSRQLYLGERFRM